MTNKMTIRDYFNEVIELAKANDRDDLVSFAESRIAVLDKNPLTRNPRKHRKRMRLLRLKSSMFLTMRV